ncbi:MAG TPA: type II secretion system protein [Sumerlaeia bacterium]|nr:type II secretion system protein [Sumerlaeia bacterium]
MTLIELFIVVAIVAIFTVGVAGIFIRMIRETAKERRQIAVREESHLVMEAFVRDLSRAETLLSVFPPVRAGDAGTTNSTGGGAPVLSLRLPARAEGESEKSMQVDYARRGEELERVVRGEGNGEVRRQVLSNSVESLILERRGGVLHVEVTCAHRPGLQRFASTLATDFFVGDRLP